MSYAPSIRDNAAITTAAVLAIATIASIGAVAGQETFDRRWPAEMPRNTIDAKLRLPYSPPPVATYAVLRESTNPFEGKYVLQPGFPSRLPPHTVVLGDGRPGGRLSAR